jgi:penicillin-binding protein 1C
MLRFPTQTAVKTGTSNDYRDAWAIGFSSKYTAGVWMGNLDAEPMTGVSGSIGPAVVLRSVFAKLEQHEQTARLFLSPKLVSVDICPVTGAKAGEDCQKVREWFRPDYAPVSVCSHSAHGHTTEPENDSSTSIEIKLPTSGLHLAMDPRIPDSREVFPFEVEARPEIVKVRWQLNDKQLATSDSYQYHWNLMKGHHRLKADVWLRGREDAIQTSEVGFVVK